MANTPLPQPRLTLSLREYRQAVQVAVDRRFEALAGDQKGEHPPPKMTKFGLDRGFDRDVIGACGELIVSKYFNQSWSAVTAVGAPDVGNWCDVRGTDYPDGHLLIQPDDPPDRPYVLVVGTDTDLAFRIVGWILGCDAKNREWWDRLKLDRPCFCVPQNALESISKLERTVALCAR